MTRTHKRCALEATWMMDSHLAKAKQAEPSKKPDVAIKSKTVLLFLFCCCQANTTWNTCHSDSNQSQSSPAGSPAESEEQQEHKHPKTSVMVLVMLFIVVLDCCWYCYCYCCCCCSCWHLLAFDVFDLHCFDDKEDDEEVNDDNNSRSKENMVQYCLQNLDCLWSQLLLLLLPLYISHCCDFVLIPSFISQSQFRPIYNIYWSLYIEKRSSSISVLQD